MVINSQNFKKVLNTQTFPEQIDKKMFVEWLDVNDNITPHFILREDFEDKKWEFLVKNWENKYDLYLADDVNQLELLEIIPIIEKKLWLEFHKTEEKLINKTKMLISLLLDINEKSKISDENIDKINDLKEQAKKAWIPEDFIQKIEKKELSYEEKKEILRSFNIKWIKLRNLTTQEILKVFFDEIWYHFSYLFFTRWIEEMWNMKTFTKEDHDNLHTRYKNDKKVKITYDAENNPKKVYDEKWKSIVSFHVVKKELDESEQPLRGQINIDKYKKELDKLRENWSELEIQKKELETTNAILREIYKYPRQVNSYWFSPKNIKEYKEIYCVWYSLLWHKFLKELWIKHKAIFITEHSALEVNIWEKKYYFDWTLDPKIYEFKYKKIENYDWIYKKIDLIWADFNVELSWYSWPAEEILQSQMLNNLWGKYNDKWEYSKALEYYKKGLGLNFNNVDIYGNLWNIYDEKWDYDKAIKCYKKSLELNPNNGKTNFNFWQFYFIKEKNYKKAKEFYIKALELKFVYTDLFNNLWLIHDHKWDSEKAIEYCNKALELDPKNSNVYNNLWVIYNNKWDYKKAKEYFNKALELNSNDSDIWNSLGGVYLNEWNYKKAKEYTNKSIELNPKYGRSYFNLWIIHFQEKNYKKAKEFYIKALELDFINSDLLNNLWVIYLNEWDYNKAKEYFNKALELDSKNSDIWNNLWSVYYNKWDSEKAIKYYEKSLELDFGNIHAWDNLWSIYYNKWEYEESIKCYKELLKLNPKNSDIYNDLWFLYSKICYYKKSIEHYKKALKLSPDDTDIWYNLWEIYAHSYNFKLCNICMYMYKYLKDENVNWIRIPEKNKNKINNFIKNKDFKWLLEFVFSFDENNMEEITE